MRSCCIQRPLCALNTKHTKRHATEPPPTLPMPLAHRAVWGCSFIAAIVSETA
jgi:hypothetical protein